MSKIRIGFSFDLYQHPLCNLDYRPKGDLYIALLPQSSSGLHMSLHPSGETHIKNDFGLYEPVNLCVPADNELESYLKKMTYNPDHGEDVLVLSCPENYKSYVQQSSKNNINLDIKPILENTPYYQIPVERLTRYFQLSPFETHVVLDETNNSIAIYNKRLGISLNFSKEVSTFEKQVETMPFLKYLWQPMKKAIEHENELVKERKIPSYQYIPKEIELNKLISKIKVKRFI